jgi:hypothetical protein
LRYKRPPQSAAFSRLIRDNGGKMMDQQIDTNLDQADEEILAYTVSDEALETAAGERGLNTESLLIVYCF